METRKYRRVRNEFDVKYEIGDELIDLSLHIGKTIDISGSGMQMMMDSRLEEGTRINLSFIKPHSLEIFHVEAVVVWTQKSTDAKKQFLTGLNFVDLSEEERKKLDYYLTD